MILELDCGNSLIKWRVLAQDEAGVVAAGVADSAEQLLSALVAVPALALRHSRMVSVRSDEETAHLVALLAERFGVSACSACAEVSLGGVRNGYEDYRRLGLDRWLALVGAYHQARGACLVIDLGTAVTSDFVAADGGHLGGFICPGMPLMRNQLRTHTRRIRYDDAAAEEALHSLTPGRSTVEAVERGCSLMLRGFVQTQLEMAQEYWGADFQTFLTGGDAALVEGMLPDARVVPDLIFVGLAIACPLS
ncbi:pantothenate kinase [Zestomonas carbonaria]|uniref:Type III pantothenate kinase n=1 Tax=Zestomonas carbonaria TaxID=2762745 RepID=A0A7U7EPK7_9GAMM|nr:pantothenate kinase [Pseudomonas carbonaria]CAD5108854.1 Type III pantothenate kinase [Pseudomonas carbonaria]